MKDSTTFWLVLIAALISFALTMWIATSDLPYWVKFALLK